MGKGTTDFGANISMRDINEAVNPRLRLARKVIEAAEALVADLGMLEGCELPFPLHKLIHAQREAVEALQEALDE